MPDDWRDFDEGRRGLSVSQLADGESAEFFIDDEPFLNDEQIEQSDGSVEHSEALRVPVVPVTVPDGFEDMSGEAVETAEDLEAAEGNEAMRYHLINSSTAFKKAMRAAFPDGLDPVGSIVTVTANQPGDAFSRSYSVDT